MRVFALRRRSAVLRPMCPPLHPRRGWCPRVALPGLPGVARVAFEQVQMIAEAVAFEPGRGGFQLGKRHRRARLAEHALECGVIGPFPTVTLVANSKLAVCSQAPRLAESRFAEVFGLTTACRGRLGGGVISRS